MIRFEKKLPSRSDKYQNILLEICYPHELLDIFTNDDSIAKKLNPFSYNDEIAELEDQLKLELWRIIEENLSPRQKEIVKMYAAGKTQMEIAKKLGVNQSSITKCIHGNVDYKNRDEKGKPTNYGGLAQKLKKIADEDERLTAVISKIRELRDNEYF